MADIRIQHTQTMAPKRCLKSLPKNSKSRGQSAKNKSNSKKNWLPWMEMSIETHTSRTGLIVKRAASRSVLVDTTRNSTWWGILALKRNLMLNSNRLKSLKPRSYNGARRLPKNSRNRRKSQTRFLKGMKLCVKSLLGTMLQTLSNSLLQVKPSTTF